MPGPRRVATCLAVLMAISLGAIATSGYAALPDAAAILDIDRFLDACPSEEDLRVVCSEIPIYVESYGRRAVLDGRAECESPVPSDAGLVVQALRVIRHMRLIEPLSWTDRHPYVWLTSKIDGIILRATTPFSYCCEHPVSESEGEQSLIVIKAADRELRGFRTSWVDPQAGVGLAGLVTLIFHEARHVDAPHTCGADDQTLSEMGAWGVQYDMAQRIADGRIGIGIQDNPLYLQYGAASAQIARARICFPED